MEFHDEQLAKDYLSRISYFRLKYFWMDMIDEVSDDFKDDVYFEDIIERYEFDKSLRQILFDAIETLEVGLRTRIISAQPELQDAGKQRGDADLPEHPRPGPVLHDGPRAHQDGER